MKVIAVVLILMQISLIVPNPNNRIESEQKESKGIGRNLSHQRRLGVFDWVKSVVGKVKDGVKKVIDKVKTSTPAGQSIVKTVYNTVTEKVKNNFNYVSTKVKSIAAILTQVVRSKLPKTLNDILNVFI